MELKTLFQRIAAAIREKEGSTGSIRAAAFPERISAISAGTDTSDATAAAGDILSGKTAYAGGEKLTGAIAVQAAQTISPGAAQQVIPAGIYLAGPQTVQGDENLSPENIRKGSTLFGVEGSSIEWKDYTDIKGSAFTTINGEFASFYITGFRPMENEDGTKKIQISVLLILQTKSAESSKQADIYVEYV